MKKLKSVLMAGVTAGMLLTSGVGLAAGNTGAYIGIGLSAVGLGLSVIFPPPFLVLGVNIDVAQTAAEYMVYEAMKETKFEWDPEPAEEYQKAAENNGGSGGCGGGGPSMDSMTQTFPFVVASLKNVGIEAIGVGPALADIIAEDTYTKILGELSFLQPKNAVKSTETKDIPGAGDCSASYSVCLKEMNTAQQEEVIGRQNLNEQNFGTAGIAHAELGLMSVQQAMANDGDGAVGKEGAKASSEEAEATFSASQAKAVQNLAGLIGSGKNTVAAMKIVALMNMELAQRLNQGNMMQGSALTIEAARALTNTAGITD